MKYFVPISPDPALKKRKGDGALARFGHLNILVDKLNQLSETQTVNASTVNTQAAGTPLIFGYNFVNTSLMFPITAVTLLSLKAYCACTDPCGIVGSVLVQNTGIETLVIYPSLGETINGQAVNVPFTLEPGASVSFRSLDCTSWQSYANTTDPAFTGVNGITGCGVDNTDPANPILNSPYVAENVSTQALTGDGCTALTPLSVCIDDVTIIKNIDGCLEAVSRPASFGYAEYVQHTQAPNNSVPPGQAIMYLTDNPSGVYNTIGITTTTGPAAIGTAFQLPVGVYMIDYENSAAAASSFAIYQGASNTVLAINTNTISGSTTATSWIHGRAIITSTTGNDWIIVSSVTGTAAIPTAGTAAGEYIARLTFLKIA